MVKLQAAMSVYLQVAIIYGLAFLICCAGLFLVACMIEKDSRERARQRGEHRKPWTTW